MASLHLDAARHHKVGLFPKGRAGELDRAVGRLLLVTVAEVGLDGAALRLHHSRDVRFLHADAVRDYGYYGVGELTAVTIVAELGDCRRFANSRDALRYSGLHHRLPIRPSPRPRASLPPRPAGAALGAIRSRAGLPAGGERSPDRAYYLEVKERIGGNRACLALARKLLKRCYHTLRELGDDALATSATRRADAIGPR